MEIQKVSLKDYTSLRIGGEANMITIANEENLSDAIKYAKENGLKIYILGDGTNTVFGDNLEKFLILKIEIKNITVEEKDNDVFITAGAGEKWDDVVKLSVDKNLWGIENMSLIPGTIGASPVQNIGAYGVELKDVLVSVRVYDTEKNIFSELLNSDCYFGYRDSLFKHETGRYIIVSVTIKLSKTPKPILSYKPLDTLLNKENLTPSDVRELVVSVRAEKLPDYKTYPNAGSFFKNPIVSKIEAEIVKSKHKEAPLIEQGDNFKIPAAWLIEHVANMKGVRFGGVGTWPNQPLVIINYGNATIDDLNFFTNEIKKRIRDDVGVELIQEVNIIS